MLFGVGSSVQLLAQSHSKTNAIPVKMQLDEELTSATAMVGQSVHMHVTEAVLKDGIEVIAAGAPVRANISGLKKPGHGDRGGQIKLAIVSAQTSAGMWVPLHTGNVRRGHRFVALLAGPCSVPFPLTMLMVGEDVRIPKGQPLSAYVRADDLR